jgi:hypothetical protein
VIARTSLRRKASAPTPGAGDAFTEYDAWTFSRLQAGKEQPADLASVSPRFQGTARHLARLPLEDRSAALRAALTWLGNSDADAILKALAAANPDGPAPEPEAQESRAGVKLTRASDIESKPVEWLWQDRVPLSALTMFAGDPEVGKSLVTIHLAAAVSTGKSLPFDDRTLPSRSVLILSAEDDPARTIAPRRMAAGADRENVYLIGSVRREDGSEDLVNLRQDLGEIERRAREVANVGLIIIDPVTAYLGGVDDHRNAEIRAVLAPMMTLAEDLGIAVVLVSHLIKGGDGRKARHRVQGSIGYVASCRANFLFAIDPHDPTGNRRLMLANGCNLAPDALTLAYNIKDDGSGARIEWESETVSITADVALRCEAKQKDEQVDPKREKQIDKWLAETLADGPIPAHEVIELGEGQGYSEQQLKRAKERIGACSEKLGFGAGWVWSLPSAEDDADDLADVKDFDEGGSEGDAKGPRPEAMIPSTSSSPSRGGVPVVPLRGEGTLLPSGGKES